ncbi:methionine--tRNA ligase [Candidatus Daviesbacteria bacterium]|nr:methionine--tRNA ligase [Candidatus Daviesbacteria bacterium]
MNKYYITSTLPYVNAEPHYGFAMEIVQADIVARYHRLIGDEVIFNTGTDEHGIKIYRAALKQGKNSQDYVDEYAAKFDGLKQALNLSYTNFLRTSSSQHKKAAQEFWRRCFNNGDIYKKNYKVKYCIGCELEKTESELQNNKCPIHPNLEIEIIEEENYFFKFSKYQKRLLDLYEKNPQFVSPDFRLKEIKEFVSSGLQDFSISRLKEKLPWGVDVPSDPKHVFYVWFDALVSYISTLGWPDDEKTFNDFWPVVQMAGKDNLRQQSAMWQAMLMSAGLPNSKQIIIHGFITNNGQKMSKSLGNVIDPFELVNKYGTDAVRFFIAHDLNTFEDSDITIEGIHQSYNANLANGLGNLVARVAKLCEKNNIEADQNSNIWCADLEKFMGEFKFNEAIFVIWQLITQTDKKINQEKPWQASGDKLREVLQDLVKRIQAIGFNLQPFMPETAQKILKQFSGQIKSSSPLFPRI